MDEEKYADITTRELLEGAKTFRVMFWITEGGEVFIKADSKKDAEEKIDAYLNAYSKDADLDKVGKFDCTHREWDIMDSETVEVK